MTQRSIEDSVLRALADTPVVLLNGARQTGNSSFELSVHNSRFMEFESLFSYCEHVK